MPKAKSPRVNVVVTPEQHSLLLELARLDPETRSAASFLRQLLDEVTPLLRAMVPAMRAAHEELDHSSQALREPLREFASKLHQMDLLPASPGRRRPQRSEDAPTKRPARRPA